MIKKKYSLLIKSIIDFIPKISEPGIFFGKAGIMIYLFHLARQTGNVHYQEAAEQLIDDICAAADTINSAGFDDGLCGVAWSIEYLAQTGYIEADTDDALVEIDNRIFKHFSSKTIDELVAQSDTLPGVAFYLIWRITPHKNKNNESVRLKRDLLISIINALEINHNKNSYQKLKEEPVRFNLMEYSLPFYLYLIAEMYKLDFYNYKLDRIVESIAPIVLSTFPLRQSHRIYFILALQHLLQCKELTGWEKHFSLLEQSIDVETLLENEFHNKGILLNNGMSGLLFLLSVFKSANRFQFCNPLKSGLIRKLAISDYFEEKEFLKNDKIGLLFGKTGIAFSLLLHGILPDTYENKFN